MSGDALRPAALPAERDLIAQYFAPLAPHTGAFGLTDDTCAISPPAGCDLIVSTDTLIAGVHCFFDDPAPAIARKALRAAFSDIAAKGADAVGYLLALSLPRDTRGDWLGAFCAGLAQDQTALGVNLLGGDTTRTPGPLSVSITAIGYVPHGKAVLRRGARGGDRVLVSGTLGDAALGLRLRQRPALAAALDLDGAHVAALQERYLLPQPRLNAAPVVRALARAAMDISDGLAGDLRALCSASGVSARIDIEAIPLSPAGRACVAADPELMDSVLCGGDDYELLLCVPAGDVSTLQARASEANIPFHAIGTIVSGDRAPVFFRAGKPVPLDRWAYTHF